MTLIKYTNIDFNLIDCYEAYSKLIFIGNNNLVIPYLNVQLMPNNPVNEKLSFLEYSYFVFTNLDSIIVSGKEKINIEFNTDRRELQVEYLIIGGIKNSNGAEVKVTFTEFSFYFPETARVSEKPGSFIPFETPNYRQTMPVNIVEVFFSKINLPKEVLDVLGENFYTIILEG